MHRGLLGLLVISLAAPWSASGQTARGIHVPKRDTMAWIGAGDQAHAALRPLDALDRFEGVLRDDPNRYQALWRAAREAVSLGMLATESDARNRWYTLAESYARRAAGVDPRGVEGYQWLAIALGRRALDQGPRERVRLAVEILEVSRRTLELDSLNAAAHHVLGEWHAEVKRLPGITRWVARKLLGGGVLGEATWEDAEIHLRRAVELEPEGLIHHLDLGRLYLDLHRPQEARVEFRQVLERPAVEPTDPLNKQRAQDLLAGS